MLFEDGIQILVFRSCSVNTILICEGVNKDWKRFIAENDASIWKEFLVSFLLKATNLSNRFELGQYLTNIFPTTGESWKQYYHRLNPGFSEYGQHGRI